MAQLTEAELRAQEASSPSQTLVIDELTKRLEVLEAERCQLATSLAERQEEAKQVGVISTNTSSVGLILESGLEHALFYCFVFLRSCSFKTP